MLSSCSGASSVGTQPSWRAGKPGAAGTKGDAGSRGAVPQSMVFAPAGKAVERYNDPPVTPAVPNPVSDVVIGALREAAAGARLPVPVADGRLQAAAADLAGVVPQDASLSYPAIEFALQRHGIIEPTPYLLVIWGPIDQPAQILEQLSPHIADILSSGPFHRVGVGAASRGERGAGALIIALQASSIETEPIPRVVPRGGAIEVRGRIRAPFEKPDAFVTRETGEVDQLAIKTAAGGAFRVTLSCQEHVGRQQVEITAIDAGGSTVLANFPVWCGELPPPSITITYDPSDRDILSADEAESRLLELVNRDRAAHRLPPLERDPAMAAVARAHSREMFETGVVAHISPRTGSASDRVRSAGIKTSVVLENVARAYGVGEAEQGLMNSPGHRANILSNEVNRIGVGIVVGEEIAGRRALFVTQVFGYRAGRMDRAALAKGAREAIAQVSSLRADEALSNLAQTQADEVASGLSNEESTRRTSTRAQAVASRFSRVSTAVVTVPRLEAFDPKAVLGDRVLTHYGLGVAQGIHKELGEHAIYLVLILAVAR
ncbi:MAG TPA: CAP domain-containing protein [Kofleriaceae bacterium]|nr:CAP domain-containing protein [Kofleriaceae bacterium]